MKNLLILIIVFIGIFSAFNARAGIIVKPVFNSGLVGYWDFQEGAGTTANDKSGYDNNGTWSGTGSHWADGKIGKAGNFNGTDDYVDLGESQWDGSWMNHTVSAWIKSNGTEVSSYDTIIAKGAGANIVLSINRGGAGNYRTSLYMNTTEIYSTKLNVVNDGKWHFISVAMDASNATFYTDGAYDGGGAMSAGGDTNYNLYIGKKAAASSTNYFNGTIDEVRIYNRALSAGEIQRIYKLSQPKILAPTKTGLVGYWSFEEGTGTKAGDMSGNGNTGTLTNMAENDWVNGKLGKALDFDGSNDYVGLFSNPLSSMSASSAAMWIKLNNLLLGSGGYSPTFLNLYTDTNNNLRIAHDEAGPGRIVVSYISGGTQRGRQTSAGKVTANSWYHIAYTFDGTNLKIYINGIVSDESAQSWGVGGVNLIGSRDATTGAINGTMDEVRIYNRALEQSEITALYNSGLAKINASQNNQLTSGLVGLWSFNGPDMDGDTAIDRSGQGNNGTLSGPVRTIGKLGQALSFDGSSDYVTTQSGTSYNLANITVSAWVYANAVGAGTTHESDTVVQRYSLGSYGWKLGVDSSGKPVWLYYGQPCTSDVVTSSGSSVVGAWHHLSGVRSSAGLELFVDGVSRGTDTQTCAVPTDSAPILMGQWKDSSLAQNFNGSIDEVRIYNRALTSDEVRRLYNMGR